MKHFLIFLSLFSVSDGAVFAAETAENVVLAPIEVQDAAADSGNPFLSPIPNDEGRTQLLKNKKVTTTAVESLPQIANNEYRQLFSKTPGLLVSEVSNQSITSFNFRGLGDPHETFNLLLLQDGLPIAADPYGYPANYFSPNSDFIESIEFIRGGAGLMYGPLPGGSLNYIMRKPTLGSRTSARMGYRYGSYQLHSGFAEVTTAMGKDHQVQMGFAKRRSDGMRPNSGFDFSNFYLKTLSKISEKTLMRVHFDSYSADQKEAGGLATKSGSGILTVQDNTLQSTLLNDRLDIDRHAGSIELEHQLDSNTLWINKVFGGFYSRESFRQYRGTAALYGGIANGTTNTIQNQDFKSFGLDSRIRLDHHAFDLKQTFAGGITFLGVDSPYDQATGATANASSGISNKQSDRKTRTFSVFAENRFEIGKWAITPGIRLENIYQSIRENLNTGATVPLRTDNKQSHVPLLGLGASYFWDPALESYFNVSQSYKPVTFQDAVPLSTDDTISEDIKEARAITYEVGTRGHLNHSMKWDSSVFFIRYDNQFGRVGTNFQNTGKARHYGWDGSLDIAFGKLHWYGNAAYLNARFDQGTLNGKTPQYAPSWMLRSGFLYYPTTGTKIGFLGTAVTDHFADDGNSASQFVPTYQVWDLTSEIEVIQQKLSVVAGINNLFDRLYWSRVRSSGIEPAQKRNFYLGLTAKL
jgi:Fe(3+) dicitrate transport protein